MTPAHTELPDWRPDPRSSLLVGGRYQLLDEIGQGATSVIFKARDSATGQVVALKVLRGSAASHPRLFAGFRREAEVGARIEHPNVIRIYESGIHEGWLYIAMEYVNGRTLADILSMCHRLTLAECEPLFRQTLAAIECIHSHGIVHRDVKPSNIMVTHEGVWKLMDFGISREQGAEATAGPSLGTPEYMSPERLLGRAATVASDVYSAGVLFYEALTGEAPFRDRNPVERCTQPAPAVRLKRPDVPEWLDRMIARALEPEAAARYPDMASMVRELGAFEAAAVAEVAPAPAPVPEVAPPAPVTQSAASFLKDEPGDLREVLGLLAESLRCLQFLEQSGAGHEPVSPHTLQLSPSGRVEISPHGPSGERDTLMVSSPKYTAPELMRGRPAAARVQPDLYALGFVIYEFLLGRAKFRAEFPQLDDRGTDLGWMEWHSGPRKARPANVVIPSTPAALSELLEQMLEKDPAKRCASYAGALKVAEDLISRTRQTQSVRVPVAAEPVAVAAKWRMPLMAVGFAAIVIAVVALLVRVLR